MALRARKRACVLCEVCERVRGGCQGESSVWLSTWRWAAGPEALLLPPEGWQGDLGACLLLLGGTDL